MGIFARITTGILARILVRFTIGILARILVRITMGTLVKILVRFTIGTLVRILVRFTMGILARILVRIAISILQRAKKVVSNSPGLVDFAVALVNSVIDLPDGQVNILGGNSNYRRTVINPASQIFGGLVEMTFRLVHASYSLPEWQAVKLTFFAPCLG